MEVTLRAGCPVFTSGVTLQPGGNTTDRRPAVTCKCGRLARHGELCHPCYVKAWKIRRKVAGHPLRSPCSQEWFDWQVVMRAWAEEDTKRKLTRAERVYLASLLVADNCSDAEAARVLGMESKAAGKLVSDVREGLILVPARAWDGTAA